MAKKSKARRSKAKKKRKKAARRPRPKQVVTKPVSEAEAKPPRAAAAPRAVARRKAMSARAAQPTTIDYAKEYGYVYADLKRVGIIAAAMLVILVTLSFIIA